MRRKMTGRLLGMILLVMCLACTGCSSGQKTPGNTVKRDEVSTNERTEIVTDSQKEIEEVEVIEEVQELEYPVMLDSGKLQLLSVFEYAGINPDYEDVFGEKIGAIHLKNVSGTYLEKTKIIVQLSGERKLVFLAEDIPADAEVLAFEIEGQEYDDSLGVKGIWAEAEYAEYLEEDKVSYQVNGNEITLENTSGDDLKDITIYYHCSIDQLLYGGKSYKLQVDALRAGESTTVTDTFCYLGDLSVARVRCE